MRVALVGTRGIPARYSGFETCAEQLAVNWAKAGHDVVAYCRNRVPPDPSWPSGIRLVRLPALRTKHLETIVHSSLSLLHCIFFSRPDVIVLFSVGNAPVGWVARLLRIPLVFNVDGADWERAKWSGFARRYLRWCASLAPSACDFLVTDSRAMQDRYAHEHRGVISEFIPYGGDHVLSNPGLSAPNGALQSLGLRPREYVLFVGRLVPENGAHELIEVYRQVHTLVPLVIVGGATYSDDYIASLERIADERVKFAGFRFGPDYGELSGNALLFVMPAEVGGTHPVLVEQMTLGNCVLVRDTDSNRETVGGAGIIFSTKSGFAEALQDLLDNPAKVEKYGALAREHAQAHYAWDVIARAYEDLCNRAIRSRGARVA
jgi:glycosyltransferase involved in cell wall biosynthesis